MIWTVRFLDFIPRIALENRDSGSIRINRIVAIIRESRFAIHDLSRLQATEAGSFQRMNMPFELGIDYGCRHFLDGGMNDKRCLILETKRYRYQQALSDMAGADIEAHDDEPEEMVHVVRDWLNNQAGLRAPGPSLIWHRFNDFMADNYTRLKARGFSDRDIERLGVDELLTCMNDWLEEHR